MAFSFSYASCDWWGLWNMICSFTPLCDLLWSLLFGLILRSFALCVLSFPPLLGALFNGVWRGFRHFFSLKNKLFHPQKFTSMVVKTTFISQPLVFHLPFGLFPGPPTNPNMRLYWCLTHQTSASVNCVPIHTHKHEKLDSIKRWEIGVLFFNFVM
jgi:hypothetical protein